MNRLLLVAMLAASLSNSASALPNFPISAINNQSSTVAVTNTFQQVWPSQSGREDCMIQNNGSNSMWVFLGATASATKGTSVVLAAGQAFYCAFNSLTWTGAVQITGTSGDAYYATGK